jgi:hypothetical protein
LCEIIEVLAPVGAEFGRKTNPFWQWFIDIRGRDCEAFDSVSDSVHDRLGENEAAPNDVDIHLPPGNPIHSSTTSGVSSSAPRGRRFT